MKLLVFVAVLAVAYGAFEEQYHCERGPTAWCVNLHTARQCNAVKHCTDTVWSHQDVAGTLEGDSSCTVCELMVDNARQLLKNKAHENEVKTLLTKACDVMPSKVVSKTCHTYTTDYYSEISTLIKNERLHNSRMVCGLVGMCNGAPKQVVTKTPVVDSAPAVKEPAKVGDKLCDDCVAFMGDLKALFTSNVTEEDFVNIVDGAICSKLGGLEDLCKQLVQTYAQQLFQYFANEFNPQELCAAAQLCKAQINYKYLVRLMIATKKSGGGEECTICKDVITELRDLDRDQAVQSSIVDFLNNKVCPYLGAAQSECEQYVKTYIPVVFEFLASELDPVKLCTQFGFCPATELIDSILIKPRIPVMTPVVKAVQPKVLKSKKVDASVTCVICEFALKEIDDIIQQNKSEAAARDALRKVCDILPSTIKTECQQFVSQYTEQVVQLLVEFIDPKVVCMKLGICPQPSTTHLFNLLKLHVTKMAHKQPKLQAGEYCSTCKLIGNYLKTILESNTTVEDFEMLMERFCGILPTSLASECQSLVEQYLKVILQLLEQEISVDEICQQLGLCPQVPKPVLMKKGPINKTLYFKPSFKQAFRRP